MKIFNRSHRSFLAAGLLLLPAALPTARTPAKPPAPEGKLDIRLLVTTEPDKVLHPKKGTDGKFSQAQPVKIAPRGQPIVGLIFFKDCKPDAAGNCNVDVDVQGFTPTGAMFKNSKGTNLWRNKKAPHAGFVQLGAPDIKVTIEANDPAGTYRVLAVAHDHNSGAESRSEASFEVK